MHVGSLINHVTIKSQFVSVFDEKRSQRKIIQILWQG